MSYHKYPIPKVGDLFGRWLVIGDMVHRPRNGQSGKTNRFIPCRCMQCEAESEVNVGNLLTGKTSGCLGCNPNNAWSHGRMIRVCTDRDLRHRLYSKAYGAIKRCTDETEKGFNYYGARGIKVIQEWIDDPSLFVEYLMQLPGHDNPKLLLDREDNNGDYRPGNLRFVTTAVSLANRRPQGTCS